MSRKLLLLSTGLVAAMAPALASAQLGQGREPTALTNHDGYVGFGAGGDCQIARWDVVTTYSSGDYWDEYRARSQDGGRTFVTERFSGGYAYYGYTSPAWQFYGDAQDLWTLARANFFLSGVDLWKEFGPSGAGNMYWDDAYRSGFVAADGELVVLLRDRSEPKFRVTRSPDRANTWGAEVELSAAGAVAARSGCVALGEGGLAAASVEMELSGGEVGLYVSVATTLSDWRALERLDTQFGQNLEMVAGSTHLECSSFGIHVSFKARNSQGKESIFLASSHDLGMNWTVLPFVPRAQEVTGFEFDADRDSELVLASWIEENGGSPRLYAKSSSDGGLSFGPAVLVHGGASGADGIRANAVYVDAGRAALAYATNAGSADSSRYLLQHAVSVDGGASIDGPFDLRPGRVQNPRITWNMTPNQLVAWAWSDGNDQLEVTGIRYPFVAAAADPITNQLVLRLAGGTPGTVGPSFACWAVSSSISGPVPHPDNAAEELFLGPSATLSHVLTHRAKLSTRLEANGRGQCLVRVPPTLAGTYYVQAWVNQGGVPGLGGTSASDVISIQL